MALSNNSDFGSAAVPKIDEELTHFALKIRARRKLLVALALGGPQTGFDLRHVGRSDGVCRRDANFHNSTLKNLKPMVEAGIVLALDDPNDRRRTLYSVSPAVKVTRDGDEIVFDFGFGVARLSADGN